MASEEYLSLDLSEQQTLEMRKLTDDTVDMAAITTEQPPVTEAAQSGPVVAGQDMPRNYTGAHATEKSSKRAKLIVGITAGALAVGAITGWRAGLFGGKDKPSAEQQAKQKGTHAEHQHTKDVPLALPPEFDRAGKQDLIRGGTWNNMPGVTDKGGKIHAQHTGLKLRKQAPDWTGKPSEYVPNPPVNTYGTHVKTNGKDFGVAVHAVNVTDAAPAVVGLYSEPDYVYDERRYYQPKTQITIKPNTVIAQVWNGDGPEPSETKQITFKSDNKSVGFYIKQEGDEVIVSAAQQEVRFSEDMYTSSEQVWFGFGDKTSTIDELSVYPAEKGSKVELVDASQTKLAPLSDNGLQQLAASQRPGLLVGAAMNLTPMVAYPEVADKIGQNYGLLKPEMAGKMQAVYAGTPGPDGRVDPKDFVWDEMDAFANFARYNGRQYNLHTLCFGEAMPPAVEAMLREVINGERPIQDVDNFIASYTEQYLQRYQDANAVDVVNEPMADTSIFDRGAGVTMNENLWYRAYQKGTGDGKRYMKAWFDAARKYANPHMQLLMNDNGAEADEDRQDVLIDLAKYTGADGVGLQSHETKQDIFKCYDADASDAENAQNVAAGWSKFLAKFEQNGLRVQISEYSVDTDDTHIQEVFGQGAMRAVLQSSAVTAIVQWSPVDSPFGFTATIEQDYSITPGNDGEFEFVEDTGQVLEKPALDGMRKGLTN